MKTYLCYIHRTHKSVADLTIVPCEDDTALPARIDELVRAWPGARRIEIFDGERPVLNHEVEALTI